MGEALAYMVVFLSLSGRLHRTTGAYFFPGVEFGDSQRRYDW